MDPQPDRSLPQVAPETLVMIAAAVTEFLGKKVRIHSARLLPAPAAVTRWAQQGRVTVQTSHNITQRRR